MRELARPITEGSDGALCRPSGARPDGGTVSGGAHYLGTRAASVAPLPGLRGRSGPACPVRGGASVTPYCPEHLRDRAGRSDADSGVKGAMRLRRPSRPESVRTRHDAVQGSPLRSDRAHSRAARACHFRPARRWGVGVRETLTASRPSAAIWQLRDGRKTPPFSRVTRWRCAARRHLQRINGTNVQHPARDDRFPPLTTRAGSADAWRRCRLNTRDSRRAESRGRDVPGPPTAHRAHGFPE